MTEPDALLLIGRIGKPHGVRGEMKVVPETDDPERFADLETCYVGPRPEAVTAYAIASVRYQHSKRGITVLLGLDAIADRDAAEALRGQLVYAHRDDLPALDEGEFFIDDLLDLDVVTTEGDAVGTIVDVMELPSHPVYVVERPGQPDALIPGVPAFIEEVDLEAGRVVLRPIEGLLD
jgi:16S rRNA processing protein RimM